MKIKVKHGGIIMTKQARIFLVSTFLITWVLWWLLAVLSLNGVLQFGQIPFMVLYIIGGNGPLIAAIYTKKVYADKEEYKDFIKQIFKFKISVLWYLAIVIVLILEGFIKWLIYSLSQGFSEALFTLPVYMVPLLLPVMVIGGGLEEVGWRGVLYPEFTKRLSKTLTSLYISLFWTLWHLPLWFIKGVPQENMNFWTFAISVIGMSFLLTVVYDGTKSIFMCIFFHSLANSYSTVLNPLSTNIFIDTSLKLFITIIVFVTYNKIMLNKRISRVLLISNFPE